MTLVSDALLDTRRVHVARIDAVGEATEPRGERRPDRAFERAAGMPATSPTVRSPIG